MRSLKPKGSSTQALKELVFPAAAATIDSEGWVIRQRNSGRTMEKQKEKAVVMKSRKNCFFEGYMSQNKICHFVAMLAVADKSLQ